MKIAITGHTKGIGLAIADACRAARHEVQGFSRTTGYSLPQDMNRIMIDAFSCDVCDNNRYNYHDDTQLEMLYRMYEIWKGQEKRIINLGSRAGMYPFRNKPHVDRYAINKHALDAACIQLGGTRDMRPLVTNIKPGYVGTDSVADIDVPKLTSKEVADTFMWILEQPPHIHISEIGIMHTRFK